MYVSVRLSPSSSMICAGDSSFRVVLKFTPAFFSSATVNFGFSPLDAYSFINESTKFVLAKISGSSDVSYRIGPFVFFPEKKVIKFDDQTNIELTEKEVSILKCLLSHGEEPVDRKKLLKQVWNYNLDVTTHTLESHIYRLRQKLETDPSIPRLIISEGGGFKINQT